MKTFKLIALSTCFFTAGLNFTSLAVAQEMMSKRPGKGKYTILSSIEATKGNQEKAYKALRKKADKLKADAVIGVRCYQAGQGESGIDKAITVSGKMQDTGAGAQQLGGDLASTSSKLGGVSGKLGSAGSAIGGVGSSIGTLASIASIFKSSGPKITCSGDAVQWKGKKTAAR